MRYISNKVPDERCSHPDFEIRSEARFRRRAQVPRSVPGSGVQCRFPIVFRGRLRLADLLEGFRVQFGQPHDFALQSKAFAQLVRDDFNRRDADQLRIFWRASQIAAIAA